MLEAFGVFPGLGVWDHRSYYRIVRDSLANTNLKVMLE